MFFELLLLDDDQHLLKNPMYLLSGFSGLAEIWKQPALNLYIPVVYTVWLGLGKIAGLVIETPTGFHPSPALFHAFNCLIHLLNAFWVWLLLRIGIRSNPKSSAPFVGALVFLLHPVQVEAVAWISGLRDLLSAFFGFMALYLAMGVSASPTQGGFKQGLRFGSAIGAFIFSLLSKPALVLLPWILGIWKGVCMLRPTSKVERNPWNLSFLILIPWMLASLAVLWITHEVQPSNFLRYTAPAWALPLISLDSLSFYLFKFILPFPLVPDYGRHPRFVVESGALFFSWIPSLIFLIFLVRNIVRGSGKRITAATMAAILTIAPLLGWYPFHFQHLSTVADRYLYFPLFWISMLLAIVWDRGKISHRTSLVIFLFFIALRTLFQVGIWQNNPTLFHYILKMNPQSFTAELNLGNLETDAGHPEKALNHFKRVLELDPRSTDAMLNTGYALSRLNRVDEAIAYEQKVLETYPRFEKMHSNLAAALAKKGRLSEALEHLKTAVELSPGMTEIHYNMALLYSKLGQAELAKQKLNDTLQLNPYFVPAKTLLETLR